MRSWGPFFDRRVEMATLARLAAESVGPITVHGPGGSGKTRLVQEYIDGQAGWTWLNPGGAEDFGELLAGLAHAGGLAEPNAMAIENYLATSSAGVVFDDVEHLVTDAPDFAPFVERLAWRVPTVVTSTVRLGVDSERLVHVNGLPHEDAVKLFTHHLRRLRPRLEVDPSLARSAGLLVEALDRLPQPVTLAAYQLELLPIDDLLKRVRAGSAWLGPLEDAGRRRDPARWVRAAWDRLDEERRYVLAQCAVFASDFEVRDAEAIVRTSGGVSSLAADLARFIRLALLQPAGADPTSSRLHMLRSTRAFLRATAEWDDVAEAVRRRHASWFVEEKHATGGTTWIMLPDAEQAEVRQAAEDADRGLAGQARRARMRAEIGKWAGDPAAFDVVAEVARDARQHEDLVALAEAHFHRMALELPTRGPGGALEAIIPVLKFADRLPSAVRGAAFAARTLVCGCQGERRAAEEWEQRTLRLLDEIPSHDRRAEMLMYLGVCHMTGWRLERAQEYFSKGVTMATEPGVTALILVTWCYAAGEVGAPLTELRERAWRRRDLLPPFFLSLALAGIAIADHAIQPTTEVRARIDEAARGAFASGSNLFGHWIDAHRGWVAWDLGDRGEAIATTEAAVEALLEMDALGIALPNVFALAWWLAMEGRLAEAERWWRWGRAQEAAADPLCKALRATFGEAHPALDAGGAEADPTREGWSRVRIARAMVARLRPDAHSRSLELLEPTRGGGGLLRRGERSLQLTLAQYALIDLLLQRWTEETHRPDAVRGFVPSTELQVSIPFDAAHPERAHVKALVRRTRTLIEDLDLRIEARRGFGYRLKLSE